MMAALENTGARNRMGSMDILRITEVGDTAFNVEFGDGIDPETNARVMSLCRAVRRARDGGGLAGLVEVVPTFRSLLVCYDPVVTSRIAVEAEVTALVATCADSQASAGRRWRIPVCYEGEFGPDLADVAAATGLAADEVIAAHCGTEFFVYMLGFMPGFAYMGDVPAILRLPRKASPRLKVPAGSVAIAESFAAIYPWESPGGWHLLGRTPVTFFDLERPQPSLLAPGDRVVFHAIGAAEYDAARRDSALVAPERLLTEAG